MRLSLFLNGTGDRRFQTCPFHEKSSFDNCPSARQKVDEVHEISNESFVARSLSRCGKVHLAPFHCRVRLFPSAATQNDGLVHDIELIKVWVSVGRYRSTTLASDQRLSTQVADQPSARVRTLDDSAPAMQKLGDGHDTDTSSWHWWDIRGSTDRP